MNVWSYVRIGLILVSVIAAFFAPLEPQAVPPNGWGALLAIFIFCPIGIVIVLGMQAANPMSARVWRRPSWSLNPFNFREPLLLFHLGAYMFLADGIVMLMRTAISAESFYVESLMPLVMAIGVFLGLQAVMLLFSSKMEHDT